MFSGEMFGGGQTWESTCVCFCMLTLFIFLSTWSFMYTLMNYSCCCCFFLSWIKSHIYICYMVHRLSTLDNWDMLNKQNTASKHLRKVTSHVFNYMFCEINITAFCDRNIWTTVWSSWHFAQTFMVPTEWILLTLVINGLLIFLCTPHSEVCSFWVKYCNSFLVHRFISPIGRTVTGVKMLTC